MQMYLISDNADTYTGLRLTGVDGVVLHEEDEIKSKLDELSRNTDIGIILVTEGLVAKYPHLFETTRQNGIIPLLVEIPDRHGRKKSDDFITEYVNKTIM